MNLNEKFKKRIDSKESNHARYDCVVLFSGGKDRTYLAHVMKEYTNGRVCLLNVDNGYEDAEYTKRIGPFS